MNVGREVFDAGSSRANAVVYRQVPGFTGITHYPLGTEVTLYLRDATEKEVEHMVRDFQIDSSEIILPDASSEGSDDGDDFDMEW